MKESDIYKIKNPGQFIQEEWKDSLDVVVAMKIEGRTRSSGYESAEAIAYIMKQVKEQNDERTENREI